MHGRTRTIGADTLTRSVRATWWRARAQRAFALQRSLRERERERGGEREGEREREREREREGERERERERAGERERAFALQRNVRASCNTSRSSKADVRSEFEPLYMEKSLLIQTHKCGTDRPAFPLLLPIRVKKNRPANCHTFTGPCKVANWQDSPESK